MVSKKNIIKHTKILLTLLVFHFLLTTFIKFQLWVDLHLNFLNSDLINLWKDFYLLFIYAFIISYAIKNKEKTINKLKKYKYLYLIFVITIIISLWISLINFHWIKSLIIWFKYDFWFLFPVIFYSLVDFSKKDIEDFYNFFLNLIKLTIILSLFLELIRFTSPKILYLLWYWPLGDWTPWKTPPMYFDTGIYGVQRMSWIFSWPNHMAFYFIAFWPLILLSIFNRKLHRIWWILYLFLLIWTLSRSWLLAFLVEIFILTIFLFAYYKNLRKKILTLVSIWLIWIFWFIGYLFISWKYHQVILRWASTKWHFIRAEKTIKKIKEKLVVWHWIWTAWPAAHYIKSDIIPESWFLQIFYELWLLWWFFWFSFLFYIIYTLFKQGKISYPYLKKEDILKFGLFVWLIWLLVQWLVLHSFEDSMVSLPLFILIWIILWENLE